jgi:hypothetical protein
MGITATLETEEGQKIESVEDPTNILHRLLPSAAEAAKYHCLSYIDRYGDTVFNHLQARKFLEEWEPLGERARDPEARELFEGIRKLAEQVRDDNHLYLKFYGD